MTPRTIEPYPKASINICYTIGLLLGYNIFTFFHVVYIISSTVTSFILWRFIHCWYQKYLFWGVGMSGIQHCQLLAQSQEPTFLAWGTVRKEVEKWFDEIFSKLQKKWNERYFYLYCLRFECGIFLRYMNLLNK